MKPAQLLLAAKRTFAQTAVDNSFTKELLSARLNRNHSGIAGRNHFMPRSARLRIHWLICLSAPGR
jgi:hypothetical protein